LTNLHLNICWLYIRYKKQRNTSNTGAASAAPDYNYKVIQMNDKNMYELDETTATVFYKIGELMDSVHWGQPVLAAVKREEARDIMKEFMASNDEFLSNLKLDEVDDLKLQHYITTLFFVIDKLGRQKRDGREYTMDEEVEAWRADMKRMSEAKLAALTQA